MPQKQPALRLVRGYPADAPFAWPRPAPRLDEIRTPAEGMALISRLLLSTELDPAQRLYAEAIAAFAEKASDLVNQLLGPVAFDDE